MIERTLIFVFILFIIFDSIKMFMDILRCAQLNVIRLTFKIKII